MMLKPSSKRITLYFITNMLGSRSLLSISNGCFACPNILKYIDIDGFRHCSLVWYVLDENSLTIEIWYSAFGSLFTMSPIDNIWTSIPIVNVNNQRQQAYRLKWHKQFINQ